MARELFHIDHYKNAAENFLNCWVSYIVSQPIQFDLTILLFFGLQYIGLAGLPDFSQTTGATVEFDRELMDAMSVADAENEIGLSADALEFTHGKAA